VFPLKVRGGGRRLAIDPEDLRETVTRMEARLRNSADPFARDLMAVYDSLLARFAADLASERDELLTRGGALMLIQEAVRSDEGEA
jgi:hypothetical protein